LLPGNCNFFSQFKSLSSFFCGLELRPEKNCCIIFQKSFNANFKGGDFKMAKIKGPLMSFDASGKLANSLVFMKWKGIPTVRAHVKPSNPKSVGQTAQRTKMSDAVLYWHDPLQTATDKSAWNLFASASAAVLSGFNQFVKTYIDLVVSGITYVLLHTFGVTDNANQTCTIDVSADQGGYHMYVKYGTSKNALINSELMTDDTDNSYSFTTGALIAGQRYYFQCYINHPAIDKGNTTGIIDLVVA